VRFSVLLPTRNRLDLLQYAIESVRRQDFGDWEVVISDNDSSEDVEGYVASLGDSRIRWVRTDRFLPVTDNWNNALANSRGEYIVMLGDDDCLLKGCLRTLSDLIARFSEPDAVYVEAVQFAYPGVIPGHPKGFVQTGYSDLLRGGSEPFLLTRAQRRDAVRKSMALRLSFSYNMQHCVVSRRLVDRLAPYGPLFQSPYPDYYASNVVMLEATEVLAIPQPMVVIGISPKSFGYYYFNDRAAEGTELLGSLSPSFVPAEARSSLLPGNPLLTSWYVSMVCIERNFGGRHSLHADADRYRYLQLVFAARADGVRALLKYRRLLSWGEQIRYCTRLAAFHLVPRLLPRSVRDRLLSQESPWPKFDPQMKTVEHQTILELFEAMPPATPTLTGQQLDPSAHD
jgi:glycosyltransferase involved in cell wall biosynthesis